ncbi:hypothetical protein RJT34_16487 [Clitoria ternatea]|uniref:Uncharacterized protein n=1 Tax=Clitoria ternatea TaxID=43366 RepID=A0AAN9J7J2_CLITE
MFCFDPPPSLLCRLVFLIFYVTIDTNLSCNFAISAVTCLIIIVYLDIPTHVSSRLAILCYYSVPFFLRLVLIQSCA